MFHKNYQSSHFSTISLFFLMSVIITACGGLNSVEPITDTTWQWVGLTETEPAFQSVIPDPENYTLILNPDGSLSIKADCNMASGSYTLDGSSLTIELGPTTMAYCGEQSLDQRYLELLGKVQTYVKEGGQLFLELENGAGNMIFEGA